MLKYEDYCVDCEHCIGFACPYKRKIPVHYCDKCENELDEDEIYDVDDEELCEDCLKDRFKRG